MVIFSRKSLPVLEIYPKNHAKSTNCCISYCIFIVNGWNFYQMFFNYLSQRYLFSFWKILICWRYIGFQIYSTSALFWTIIKSRFFRGSYLWFYWRYQKGVKCFDCTWARNHLYTHRNHGYTVAILQYRVKIWTGNRISSIGKWSKSVDSFCIISGLR